MDDKSRLQLQKMIDANDVKDQTDTIRSLRHSEKIIPDIRVLQELKFTIKNNPEELHNQGMQKCSFLYNNYTDIYNKIKNDEIDLNLLNQFLNVLQLIENGKVDQHEGSYMVGTILKEIYIDSALKKSEKLDKEHPQERAEFLEPVSKVGWKQYKMQNGL